MTDQSSAAYGAVPTAEDFPDCRACQMWRDAGASWPRPCRQHYGGEPGASDLRTCAWMGCKHPEERHGENGCDAPVMDYYTVRYTAEGDKLPPQERPCGCTWVEPVVVKPRPVKDNPQS